VIALTEGKGSLVELDERRDVIVIAASAGGVEALRRLVGLLPADLKAAVFVVMHISPSGGSVLPKILDRLGTIPAAHAVDSQPVEPGRIYVAPPDRHLLIQEGQVRLGHGPRQNGHRPSADALFRSAALAYGPRVIALVLSGTLDDGASGAQAVAQRGGVVAVQDPEEATYPGMPNSVISATGTKLILPVDQLAKLITRLVAEEAGDPFDKPDADLVVGNELMLLDEDLEDERQGVSEPSEFVCPDCGGTLYHTKSPQLGPFRCRIGHAWSPGALLAQQSQAVENALWAALRTLQERADLSRRLAEPARKRGHLVSADMFDAAAAEADRAAVSIRAVLNRRNRGFSAVQTDEVHVAR